VISAASQNANANVLRQVNRAGAVLLWVLVSFVYFYFKSCCFRHQAQHADRRTAHQSFLTISNLSCFKFDPIIPTFSRPHSLPFYPPTYFQIQYPTSYTNPPYASLECTFLGPSRKRGPPKGYIDAIEARLHQTEALLGIIISASDERAQSLLRDIAKVGVWLSLTLLVLSFFEFVFPKRSGNLDRAGTERRKIARQSGNYSVSSLLELCQSFSQIVEFSPSYKRFSTGFLWRTNTSNYLFICF